MAELKKLGFYVVHAEYLKFLHERDPEVYYDESYRTLKKPFVGIIIGLGEYQYFIPLTSAKEKHKISTPDTALPAAVSKSVTASC